MLEASAQEFPRAPARLFAWSSPDIEIRGGAGRRGLFALRALRPGTCVVKLPWVFVHVRDVHTIQLEEGLHQAGTDEADDYINHACSPNCALDFDALEYWTVKPIAPKEELTLNYLTFEWEMSHPFRCSCGRPSSEGGSCHELIRGFAHLDPEEQFRMLPHVSPYLRRRLLLG